MPLTLHSTDIFLYDDKGISISSLTVTRSNTPIPRLILVSTDDNVDVQVALNIENTSKLVNYINEALLDMKTTQLDKILKENSHDT